MSKTKLINSIQQIKLNSLRLFPENKMFSTVCNGTVSWWEYFDDQPTCVMEHDVDDGPDEHYIQECLEEHYGSVDHTR
jgi:hypothetical protein